jgi:hypothetical protein
MIGRDGEIRTRDPLHPMQVRYQAAPRPDDLKAGELKDQGCASYGRIGRIANLNGVRGFLKS